MIFKSLPLLKGAKGGRNFYNRLFGVISKRVLSIDRLAYLNGCCFKTSVKTSRCLVFSIVCYTIRSFIAKQYGKKFIILHFNGFQFRLFSILTRVSLFFMKANREIFRKGLADWCINWSTGWLMNIQTVGHEKWWTVRLFSSDLYFQIESWDHMPKTV